MKINSNRIVLFRNISQFDFEDISYDFHNDFDCIQIEFKYDLLTLIFRNTKTNLIVFLSFQNASLTFFQFDFMDNVKNLTIDNLYRGKFENDGKLIEFENNKGYFYIEFYEGQKIELWCESLSVAKP